MPEPYLNEDFLTEAELNYLDAQYDVIAFRERLLTPNPDVSRLSHEDSKHYKALCHEREIARQALDLQ